MLSSSLLPVEISAALLPFTVTAKEGVTLLMDQLCRERTSVSCFIEGGFISAEAQIGTVLSDDDVLAMVAASQVEHDLLTAAKSITVVGLLPGSKIQFSSMTRNAVETPAGPRVQIAMPTEVLQLQRRRSNRITPSRLTPLECMVRGQANLLTLQKLPVLDISMSGVALLTRHTHEAFDVGYRLHNCSFDLGLNGRFVSDLIVRHVERLHASGGWRYGCVFADIGEDALATLHRYIERFGAFKKVDR